MGDIIFKKIYIYISSKCPSCNIGNSYTIKKESVLILFKGLCTIKKI